MVQEVTFYHFQRLITRVVTRSKIMERALAARARSNSIARAFVVKRASKTWSARAPRFTRAFWVIPTD